MKRQISFIMILILLIACKKLINTSAGNTTNSYLVVNGNIVSNDTTVISLSRTVNVTDSLSFRPELGATVSIEEENGASYPLLSMNNGNYVSATLNLSTAKNYRLQITTANGKQYASDYIPVKESPPIDTVTYEMKSSGLQINVNTHDPANNTHYFRWEYTDTYIIHSKYKSNYMVVDHDTTTIRPADQQIYECWVSDTSSNIILGSSARLSSDVITGQQVNLIPSGSEKLGIRYSILVKQYALTSDAYNYYTQLKQNNEKLGTIFAPQPSDINGNIHCISNPSERVIGYLTAGSASKSRIFIDNSQLPGWTVNDPDAGCFEDTLLYKRIIKLLHKDTAAYEVRDLIYTGIQIPIDKAGDYPKGGFVAAFPICADCTLKGVNKPPIFWK